MQSNAIAVAALLAAVDLAGACGVDTPDVTQAESDLTWTDFMKSVAPLRDGTFIVDGDIRVDGPRELEAYYKRAQTDYRQVRAAAAVESQSQNGFALHRSELLLMTADGVDSVWPVSNKFTLTYCVSSNFGTRFNQAVTELAAATQSWSELVGVQYQFVDSSPCDTTTNTTFDVVWVPSGAGFFGTAFFPHQARNKREIFFSEDAFTTTLGGRDIQGIMRHELGHTLGFRHEHIVLSPTCTGEPADEPSTPEVENYRALTAYDVNSVMHYPQCRPSMTGGYRQTALDYAGAISIYGLAPALIEGVSRQ
jgi:hypothetical protein